MCSPDSSIARFARLPEPQDCFLENGRDGAAAKDKCVSSPFLVQLQPSASCAHNCTYCPPLVSTKVSPLCFRDDLKDDDVVQKTFEEAERMLAIARKRIYSDRVSRLPELHLGTLGDPFQPSERVQTRCVTIMTAWLVTGCELSIVTKGVPFTAEIRTAFLSLCEDYHEKISFQCSCSGLLPLTQSLLEPGAPMPQSRFEFLADVIKAGVARASLRIAPIVPLFNDTEEDFSALMAAAGQIGVQRVVAAFAVVTEDYFRRMPSKRDRSLFEQVGSYWYVKRVTREMRTTELLEAARRHGVSFSICGCSCPDWEPSEQQRPEEHKSECCSISWRSVPPWSW